MQTNQSQNQKLNALLIGTGGQGARRGYAIKLTSGWTLAGVFDTELSRANCMARKWKCKSYSDAQTGIKANNVDVVVIATPPVFHDEFIQIAIDSGKHVLCEKPLSINPESAQRLAENAEKNGLILATGFNHRFYQPILDAIELIKNQTFGELIHVNGRIGQKLDDQCLSGWLGDFRISGGGVLTDNGSHLIDLIQIFTGQLDQVENIDFKWDGSHENIETFVSANLTGSHGVKVNLEFSWMESVRPYLFIELECLKGTIRISAFPWRLEMIQKAGEKVVKNYWNERIAMKLLGLKSPGLERGLLREMHSLRGMILGNDIKQGAVTTATGFDGANVAKTISAIRQFAAASSVHKPSGH